jgi:prenyltransferase beta subunit
MLQVARLAPQLLHDSSDLVREFVLEQISPEGGFNDREGKPDLYYTVFGIECLLALRAELPVARIAPYLESFVESLAASSGESFGEPSGQPSGQPGAPAGTGKELDLVHLSCLARSLASLTGGQIPASTAPLIKQRLDRFRSADGGYASEPGSDKGTVYGCFLAVGAYQDLGAPEDVDAGGIGEFLRSMETADGGYANDPRLDVGTAPAAAAAIALQRNLDLPPRPGIGDWLVTHCRKAGGFSATPRTPVPDLLSTATTLHALAGLEYPLGEVKEPCLDFVDSLWTSRGAFYGHWADETLDCEYTYYGLLALGHLSL